MKSSSRQAEAPLRSVIRLRINSLLDYFRDQIVATAASQMSRACRTLPLQAQVYCSIRDAC